MNVVINGLEKLVTKMNKIRTGMGPAVETSAKKATIYVHSQVPPYPTPPPMSTYRRTGTLGRTTYTEVRGLGSKAVGVIGNPMVYAPWVISDEAVGSAGPQAGVHKGRWYTLQGVVKKAHDTIVRIYREEVLKLFK